jgi:hypothetical protein
MQSINEEETPFSSDVFFLKSGRHENSIPSFDSVFVEHWNLSWCVLIVRAVDQRFGVANSHHKCGGSVRDHIHGLAAVVGDSFGQVRVDGHS